MLAVLVFATASPPLSGLLGSVSELSSSSGASVVLCPCAVLLFDSVEVGADETSWVSHCGLTFVLCLRLDRSLIAQVFEMYKTDAAILCDDIVTLLQESLASIPTVTGMHKNM